MQTWRVLVGTAQGAQDRLFLEYGYGTTDNNGNVMSQTISIAAPTAKTWTQSYGYDGVNRLTSAQEAGGWSRGYGYDQFGNRWVTSSTLKYTEPLEPKQAADYDVTSNRLKLTGYDTATGEMTQYNPYQLKYDHEGHVIEAKSDLNGTVNFAYDGQGRRIRQLRTAAGSTETTYFVYDAFGNLAAEYTDPAPVMTAARKFLSVDALGSTRLVTDASGAVLERYDYEPFGRLLFAGPNGTPGDGGRTAAMDYPEVPQTPTRLLFTGAPRDLNTGLDYLGARYLSGAQGRFTSPDEPFADQAEEDPQSWNLYTYARNNPLVFTDPTGRAVQMCVKDRQGVTRCGLMFDWEYAKARQNNPGIYAPPAGAKAGLEVDSHSAARSHAAESRAARSGM